VEDTTERVDVGPAVDAGALDLLRGDVGDRADEHALAGQALRGRGVLREPEVAQPRLVAGDEDVRRLDVAMDQAGGVRDVERSGDVRDQRDRPLGLERPLAAQKAAQVDAFDPLHRDVEEPAVFAGVEHRDEVGMLEQRGDAALAQEPLAEPGVGGDGRVEHLERHRAPLGIAGQVDGSGGALAQQRLDPVTGDLRARRERVGHGHRAILFAQRRAAGKTRAPGLLDGPPEIEGRGAAEGRRVTAVMRVYRRTW